MYFTILIFNEVKHCEAYTVGFRLKLKIKSN